VKHIVTARADIVGSLLRPQELLEARERYVAGGLSASEFKRIEDRAVDRAIGLQERAGLPVVTDGEMRRESFQSQMVEAVEGFGEHDIDAWLWGEWHGDETVGDKTTARPQTLGVVGKLQRRRHLSVEEFVYARGRTERIVKVTLPSPSMYANLWSPELSAGVYPTLDLFLEDVAQVLREEVEELARLGAEYIQLDAPHYPLLLDPKTRAFYEGLGWDLDHWLSRGIELDNYVIGDHPDVTFSFHLCRGNQGSRWLVSGSYEPLARRIFGGINAQRLMLEYDDTPARDEIRARGPTPRGSQIHPSGAAGPEPAVWLRHLHNGQRPKRRRREVQAPYHSGDCGAGLGVEGDVLPKRVVGCVSLRTGPLRSVSGVHLRRGSRARCVWDRSRACVWPSR
jgi:5-methyltetrahydropteroyltriglutamate--homocysteine methyltransferase